jgi:hypothetical protein
LHARGHSEVVTPAEHTGPAAAQETPPDKHNQLVPLDSQELRRMIVEHDLGLSDALVALNQVVGSASSAGESRRVDYHSADGQVRLAVDYTLKGDVGEVWLSPDPPARITTALVDAFSGARPRRVLTSVAFSQVPVRGWWRYRERFQILPMPPDALATDRVYGPHPFLLQVAYEGTEGTGPLDDYRASVATREVGRLVSGILTQVEDRFGQYPARDWFIRGDPSGWETEFGWRGYYFENMPPMAFTSPITSPSLPKQAGFTDPSGLPALAEVAAESYFDRADGISAADVLDIPDSLDCLLHTYFTLSRELADRTLRWCHWLNHAQQVSRLSASASQVASVQAVEALIAAKDGHAARFRAFLDEYAPGKSHESQRKEFYRLRSGVSHGGKLLAGELRSWAFGDFNPQAWRERQMLSAIQSLARLAGTNWLQAQATS